MLRLTSILLLLSLSLAAQNPNQNKIKKHVKYLASDQLEGRGTGTRGEVKAAQYIIKSFKKSGLKPWHDNDFKQAFTAKKENHGEVTAHNIIGYLDNGKQKTIIIGAHYDHLGLGDQGSSLKANSEGEVHNGADDNASGVASLLELARYFSKNKIRENYNFIFVAFSGEELGLIGSKSMAGLQQLHPENINLMINMDMVGRYRADKGLTLGGVGTSPELAKLAPELASQMNIKNHLDSSGVGPSDHTSFYLKDIPVLFLFTGTHNEYHKPTDDTYLINFDGIAMISNYVINLVSELPQLTFKKAGNPQSNDAKRSFKVTMGVIPDYAYSDGGLKVDGVTEGKPAEAAGLQAGDIVLKIGNKEIKDIYSYMEVLGESEPSQTVILIVKRGDQTIKLNLTF